jgi:zinc resistance-associated protein
MLKPVIAATAILAIAGSSIVYAQQGSGEHNGFARWRHHGEHHHRPSPADMAAFTDARIAALKAGLELTPDQQKNWPAFEQALRELAQLRVARIQTRQERHQQGATQQGQNQNGPFDRLARRADGLAKTSAALKKVADAGGPLYQSLSDAQKERFKMLARMLRPHPRMRFAFNEHNGGGRQGGHGFGAEHHRFAPDSGGNDGSHGSQL